MASSRSKSDSSEQTEFLSHAMLPSNKSFEADEDTEVVIDGSEPQINVWAKQSPASEIAEPFFQDGEND